MLRTSFLAIALATGAWAADNLAANLVSSQAVNSRLRAGAVPLDQRQQTAAELFRQAGCDHAEQRVNKRASNVICTLKGEGPSTVIVGAHYDYVPQGDGIVDDWTGVSLLSSLYQALKDAPRKHTYVFVAFADEEKGLVGSRRFVKELTKDQRAQTVAYINLECLGMTPMKVWATRSSPALVKLLLQVTRATGAPVSGMNVDNVGDDDTHPFFDAKIPVLSLHSISQQTFGILHSKMDNLNNVQPAELYSAYRSIAFFLAYLDLKLP